MKPNITRFLITCTLRALLLATFLPAPAFAALGKTADECNKLYGRPTDAAMTHELRPPARTEYAYSWSSFYIRAKFVGRDVKDSRCGHVNYCKASSVQPNGPIQELTKPEIQKLLALNANGHTWEPVQGGWKRSDNRAFAVEVRYTHNNLPDNALLVFDADFYPKDDKSFAEVRASLLGHTTK